jgi:hypothetical protein
VVSTIVNNNNTARISIRKALTYSGCSKNIYYGNKDHRYDITAATAVTPSSSSSSTTTIEKEIQQISMERPTYGTRRMAAMLTRILGIPVNRKRVQREYSERWVTLHHLKVRRKSYVQKYLM